MTWFSTKTNAPNVVKFLDDFIQIHGDHCNSRLDQSICLISYKDKNSLIKIILT